MLETKDLILAKAKFEDWQAMYKNVWRHPESARYMLWEPTTSAEAAQDRARRSVEFQKDHDAFFVYLKATGEAIGFAGLFQEVPGVWAETGLCLGPDFVGKGYGRQLLGCLIQYARERGGREFRYSAWEENLVSRGLAEKMGFQFVRAEEMTRPYDGCQYVSWNYRLEL